MTGDENITLPTSGGFKIKSLVELHNKKKLKYFMLWTASVSACAYLYYVGLMFSTLLVMPCYTEIAYYSHCKTWTFLNVFNVLTM